MSSTGTNSGQKSTLVQRELGKAANLIKEDSKSVGGLAAEAVKSGAYIYPIQGIYYFLTHPKIFNSVKPLIYQSAMMSAIVLALMSIFTYLPQVAILALVSGPLAFIAAVPAVLAESWFIISFINKAFIIGGATEKVFDAVLVARGYEDLVQKGRTLKKSGAGTVLGKSLLKPISSRFSTEGLVRYILSLPLNAIPGVGTAFFLGYNGQHAGPSYHNRYFQLKGLSSSDRASFVQKRRGAYTSFGATALALGIVPIAGTLFSFTSAAGAALWAADLEKAERGGFAGTAAASEGGKKDKVEVGMGRSDEL